MEKKDGPAAHSDSHLAGPLSTQRLWSALPGRWTEQNGVFRKVGGHMDMWPSKVTEEPWLSLRPGCRPHGQ